MSATSKLARSMLKRTPLGFVGMAVLVVCVEARVNRRAPDDTPWGTWAWRVSGQSVRANAPGCELLCFGDSLAKLAVIPAVMGERLGVRAYNFAICAAQAPASYFMLRRALEAGARPRAVVVDYKPGMLAGGPRDFGRNWPELLNLSECVELSWAARDATFFASSTLAILFPTVRARHDIRINILLALNGAGSYLRADTLRYWRHWLLNQGGQVTAPNPDFRGEVTPEIQKRLMSQVFWCDRLNALYVRKFLALASARGIKVFWLLPPISPAVQRERERTGAEQGHLRFVRAMQAEFPNMIVVDGRHSEYGNSVFIDPLHLDSKGACSLSVELAEIVDKFGRSRDFAPRWINLPTYRRRSTSLVLEPIEDAIVALKRQEGRQLR